MHDNRHRMKPNWLHRLGVKGKQGELCVDFPKHTKEFKIPQRRRRQRRLFKSEFASFKSLSRLFQERTLSNAIELSGYELRRTISMFRKERKFRGYLFTSSIKRETIGFCTSKSCSDGKKKKMQKEISYTSVELLFCPFKLLIFMLFILPLPSRLYSDACGQKDER